MDPAAPRHGRELQDGVVHLKADAMCASDLPEHPGVLSAHRGQAVVPERAHEGHCCLLSLPWRPWEPQGTVLL